MPAKQYIVCLTEDERKSLNKLTTTGKASARKINHARILQKSRYQSTRWRLYR